MDNFYSCERNVQILVYLMKAHGVRKVVVSPGTTNICLVGSLQSDPFFEIYSSVDERSAAYIACGMAAESGEPVALSCTGATASRNYIPGLTEAYYRNLPVLAITSTQHPGRVGHYIPQVIDRGRQLNDMVKISVSALIPFTSEDEWECNVNINKALIELRRNGGGPVHINLMTAYSKDFSIKELPPERIIKHYEHNAELPELRDGHIGIFVGAHVAWDRELTDAVDKFCDAYGAVVFCDHTSNYIGKYRIDPALLCNQKQYTAACREVDTMIHIGQVSGAYMFIRCQSVWRVNPDGEVRDSFRKLEAVFQMSEAEFFQRYTEKAGERESTIDYLTECKKECQKLLENVPELPFCNAWIAQHTGEKLPKGCVLHLGILNTLRTWNFFPITQGVNIYANTGGFGIDGGMSSLIGGAIANSNKLFFGVLGDLAFFYDMNSIGNRHVANNVRIMLINNGRGTEFRNYNHLAARFGEDADPYMAGAGHFGNKSSNLVKHYAQDLGFEYMCASCKEEYLEKLPRFVTEEFTEKPILFEIFIDSKDESDALEILYNLRSDAAGKRESVV